MLDVGYGERIRVRREGLKLSQEQLGVLAGVDKETVNRIEHDQNVTLATLRKTSSALGLSMVDLFRDAVSQPDRVVLQPETSTHQVGDNALPILEDRLHQVEAERDSYRETLASIADEIAAILLGGESVAVESRTRQVSGEHRGPLDRKE